MGKNYVENSLKRFLKRKVNPFHKLFNLNIFKEKGKYKTM